MDWCLALACPLLFCLEGMKKSQMKHFIFIKFLEYLLQGTSEARIFRSSLKENKKDICVCMCLYGSMGTSVQATEAKGVRHPQELLSQAL